MEPTPANLTPDGFELRAAIRAEPGTPEAAGLEGWLEGLEERRWRALLVELREIAAGLSPRYRDVVDAEDVIGELAVLACDRWLPAYLAELKAGSARASLRAYLKLRLAGHLAEMRRKRKRRAQLLSEHVGPRPILGEVDEIEVSNAVLVGGASDPHGDAVVEEIVRKAGKDPSLRAILALRYAGFSQDEIAQRLEVSRPTVSRRLAAVATAIAVLFAAVIALAWWAGGEDIGHEAIAREDVDPRPVVGPGGGGEVEPREDVDGWDRPDVDRRELERRDSDGRDVGRDVDSDMDRDGDRALGAAIDGGGLGRSDEMPAPSAPVRSPLQARPELFERTSDMIRSVVALHRQDVQRCFDGLALPPLNARVDVTIAIGANGVPTEVRARGGGDPLDGCVADAVRAWRFGPAASATRTTVPFVFHRDDSTDTQPSREERARDCTMRGDNECVIGILEGRARSASELTLLIEAYRARGQNDEARRHMRILVARFPSSPRAAIYRQILARSSEAPTGTDIEAQAAQCTMSGDNACVIRLLEGRTRNANQLAILIEAYRARGQTSAAREHMAMFVQRYATHPRTRTYQQFLSRQ
jgi:DNA-directed RNA polymerase specialized sigma24 family protein